MVGLTGPGAGPGGTRWAKPNLVGELVTIRPFREADVEPAWEMVNEPEGQDLTATHETFDPEQIRQWYLSRNEQDDRLDLAIEENATAEFVGEVVLNEYEPSEETASFRISLRGPAWFGRGLGTEATQLIIDHGFDTIGLRSITLEVLARNPRARRSYEKVGFRVTGQSFEDGEDWIHMTIDRPSNPPEDNP